MKDKIFGKYFGMFVIGVLLIAVYKTFDNIENLWNGFLYFLGILTPVVVAFGIAFLLYPICKRLEALILKSKPEFIKKIARPASVLIVYVVIIAFLVTVPSLFMPYIKKSINELVTQFPSIVTRLMEFLKNSGFTVDKLQQYLSVESILKSISFNNISQYISNIVGAGSALFSIFVCIIMSIYILIDRKNFKDTTLRITRLFVKKEIREPVGKYLKLSVNFIYKYLFCQIIDALVVMVLASVVLSIMGVKYSLLLGIFMGFMNLIPYFGAIAACVVICVITLFFSGFSKALWVLLALIILQQVDSNLIQPAIVKEGLSVKPFWVLVGILVGSALFGLIGILLAVPFMAITRTILEDVLTQRENKVNL